MSEATELDVFSQVRSTATMDFSDTLVKCHNVDEFDENNLIQYMARQKYMGANGSSTG